MVDYEQAILDHLALAGVGAVGISLFVGPVRPSSGATGVAARATFILTPTPGFAPARVHFPRDGALLRPTVQIRVRSENYAEGITRARNIYTLLATSRVFGLIDISAMGSGPAYLEQDENGLHHWSLNFEVMC